MTGNIKGLSLDLGLDTAGIDTGLKGLKSKLTAVNSEMKANMSAFDRSEKSAKKYDTQLTGLNKKLDLQKAATSAAKVEYEKMVEQHGKGSVEANKAEKAYNDQTASLNNLERHVGSLTDEYKAFQKEQEIASSRFGKLSKSLDEQGDKFQAFGGKMTAVGGTMTKISAGIVGGVAAIGGSLFALTSKAAETGDEIAKNATKLGVTTDFYQEMDYWAGQNGVSHDNMEKSMKRLNQRIGQARAGNEKYSNALERLGVDMGALEDGTLSTEDAMAKSISSLSSMTNEQDKAALASELFGTKLAQEMMPALQDGSLTMEEARKKAEELGIVIGQDQLEAAEDFQDAQDDMKRSMGMITTSIGLELMPMFQKMTEYITDNLPRIKEIISDTFETAVEKVTGVVTWFRELSPATQKGIGAFVAIGVALGPVLMIVGKFISIIGGVMKVLSPMAMAVAKAGGLFKMLGGALAVLTSPIGIVVGIIALLTAGFIIAYKRSDTFRKFISKLGESIKGIFSKIGDWVKIGFDAILGFFSGMKDKFNSFRNEEGAQLTEAFKNIGNFIKAVMGGIWTGIKWAFDKIKSFIDFMMPAILFVIETVWGGIKTAFSGALDIIMGYVKVFSGVFTGDFNKVWEGVKQIFTGAIKIVWGLVQTTFIGVIIKAIMKFSDDIKKFFSDMWKGTTDTFNKYVKSITDFLKKSWENMSKFTTDIFNGIFKFFNEIWTKILNFIIDTLKKLYNNLKNNFNLIKDVTTTIFTVIWDFLKNIWDRVSKFILDTIKTMYNNLKNNFNLIKNTTTTIFTAIWDFLKGVWDKIKNFITTMASGILKTITGAWNSVKTTTSKAFTDVFNSIKGRFTDIVNAAKALPGRIGDGIGSMASKVTAGVTKVVNLLASTLGKGVNGVIGGVNWVLGKIGVTTKIPTWTVPRYAQGTGGHPGGLAVVGDGKGRNAGSELIQTPDGKYSMSPAKETLVNLPKGTQVLSALNTRNLLGDVPKYAKGIGSKILDLFEYIKKPSKLLDVAFSALGVSSPAGGNFIGDMARGAFGKVKDGAIEYVKKMLTEFGESKGSGFGPPFRLTSRYGMRRNPVTGEWAMHQGDDYGAPSGTPIPNQAPGTVVQSGFHGIRGNFVRVKSGAMERIYQHNSRNSVSVGQVVRVGQTVGTVGSTGRSTGAHLHYEVLRNGRNIDPKGFEKGGLIKKEQLVRVGEKDREEMIIPLHRSRRTDAMKLLAITGKRLGVDGGNSGSVGSSQLKSPIGGNNNQMVSLLQELIALMKNQEPQPLVLQTVLNGRVLAEEIVDDVSQLLGGKANLEMLMKGMG